MVPPPIDMMAPAATYTVFYGLFVVSFVPIVAWMGYQAWRQRSIVPVAALAGGLITGLVVPPIFNHLTLVWFPSNIPLAFVTAFGMRDPWFDALGYAMFIGFGGYLLYRQLLSGQGARAVYAAFSLWAISDLVLELPFLAAGLYTYYGDQPFRVGGFPLHWVVFNGFIPVMSGLLMYVFVERWPSGRRGAGWRVVAIPPLAAAALMVPIFPVALALHADVPTPLRWAASTLSMVGCIVALVKAAGWTERQIAVEGRAQSFVSLLMGISRAGDGANPPARRGLADRQPR